MGLVIQVQLQMAQTLPKNFNITNNLVLKPPQATKEVGRMVEKVSTSIAKPTTGKKRKSEARQHKLTKIKQASLQKN